VNTAPPTAKPVLHGSFTVARDLDAAPARVFAAYAEPSLRTRWFRMPSTPEAAHHELDFRVGGHEIARRTFGPSGTPEHLLYRAAFCDIATDERIVFTYDFTLDGVRPRHRPAAQRARRGTRLKTVARTLNTAGIPRCKAVLPRA
jgi:uncharacterized protein YndB with AHSA1/START domain